MAARLVYELRAPYVLGDKHVVVSASVDIASARDAIAGAADLVRNADVAMYMAKANGKSGFAIFDPGMHEAMRERHELSVDLQRAVDLDQLALLFQPIIDLRTGGLAGVEALVRWHHPTHGLVMPDRFIEIAEESGTILRSAAGSSAGPASRCPGWPEDGRVPPKTFVSVNVSAREIQQLGFLDAVKAVLAESGLRPDATHARDHRDRPAPREPGDRGHPRWGPGDGRPDGHRRLRDRLLPLSHLRQFPIDALKIANEFVQDADAASKSSALAGAIVAMSRSLARDRRRRHRDFRASRPDAAPRLRLRPGLCLRATDGRADLLATLGYLAAATHSPRPRPRRSGPRHRWRPPVGATSRRVAAKVTPSPRRRADPPAPERLQGCVVARSDWARPDWVRPDPRDLSSAYPSLTTGAWRTRAPSASARTRTSARLAREIAAVSRSTGRRRPSRARAVGQPGGADECPVHARGADPLRRPHDVAIGGGPGGVREPDPGAAAQTVPVRGVSATAG